jgi:hypothetical protein
MTMMVGENAEREFDNTPDDTDYNWEEELKNSQSGEKCKTCRGEIGTNKDCSECKSYVEACALGEFR